MHENGAIEVENEVDGHKFIINGPRVKFYYRGDKDVPTVTVQYLNEK